MIRAVSNKRLHLTDDEYTVYNKIISTVDKHEFDNIFITDNNGYITAVFPPIDKQISMIVVYFLFNIMINQKVRMFDSLIDQVKILEKKVEQLEGK